ncbi:MFS transporter [Rhodococcus wratislaviensis]|uniref:Putative proline/betaine transporter n=1 Tax=Rhodococcus wratislaviensis NBRC 100605 TaxID=1219028 RepID=X0PZN3_RHOWR|nr:MFS transporter [Rhodococcus wratislaviensis]GAF49043.1 putative major facilitator superfamily transporter [Rhodococcus wratislaviensis NBRC 100605]
MTRFSESSKVGFASGVGTTVEWYDFFIYGTAAGLVFNKIFFPGFDSLIGTLLSFATFSAAFVARPVGGVVFGHFGDRIGRKSMLVITLTVMGLTTLGVGVLPSYEAIGVAAPIILVTLRFVQGLALGGEIGGAILMAVEHAPSGRRGYYGSWVQMGVPAGLMLGNTVFLLLAGLSPESFLEWGWRIPFLIGGLFVAIGLLVRLHVGESPNFDQVKAESTIEKLPIAVVIRQYPRQVLLICGAYFAIGVTFYGMTVFGLSYGVAQVGYTRNEMLALVLIAMAVTFVALPIFGTLSDKLGRKPVFLTGVVAMLLFTFPWFWLVNTRSFALALLGFVVFCLAFSTSYGPLAAFFAEAFDTHIRYTGISFGYTIGTLASSAPAPIVATFLLDRTGSYAAVAVFMVVMCLVSVVCVVAMRETYREDWSVPDGGTAPASPEESFTRSNEIPEHTERAHRGDTLSHQ